jgi:hypothetical protein
MAGTAPRLDFLESDGSSGFNGTTLIRDTDIFSVQTRNGATFVSNDYRITTNASGALTHEWRIGNVEQMRIASNGNVGIGTAADAATKLEVSSDTNPTAVFIAYISGTTMTVTGITSGALAVGDRVFGAGVEWNTVITAQTSGSTGASGDYTVNNSQTVSTAPTGIAMSSAASGKSVLRLTNTDTTEAAGQTTGGVEFFGSDASTPGAGVKGYVAVIAESATPDSAMIFGTSDNTASTLAVERMRITSVGDVGIGTTSPTAKLDVNGTTNATNITRGGSQVYSRDNILGTVSESAGIPTGGIIEKGPGSANGEFIKFADGTMICWDYATTTQSSSTATGDLFRTTTTATWTFPAAFSVAPVVSGQADASGRLLALDLPTTTDVDFRQYSATSSGTLINVRLTAIGRWY